MMAEILCENCGSDQVQNIQVVYESGTSRYRGKTTGVGVGITTGGVGLGIGRGRSKGTQKTELAKRLSPPFQKRIRSNVIWFFVIGFFGQLMIVPIAKSFTFIYVLELIVIGQAVYKIWWNRNVWPKQHGDWRRQFFCHRCGHVWHPNLVSDEVAASK